MSKPWRNGPTRFGRVSRFLHWAIVLLVLVLLPLGFTIARMQVSLGNLWLFGLHKSLGLTLLGLMLARILWHLASPPPAPLPAPIWKKRAAKATHQLLYVLLLAVPLSGWIASAATGIDVVLFGRFTLPRIAPVSEAWEDAGFAIHAVATKLLAALVLLHVTGAFTRRDGTLGRMTRGST